VLIGTIVGAAMIFRSLISQRAAVDVESYPSSTNFCSPIMGGAVISGSGAATQAVSYGRLPSCGPGQNIRLDLCRKGVRRDKRVVRFYPVRAEGWQRFLTTL
jgi:hypothetical protein